MDIPTPSNSPSRRTQDRLAIAQDRLTAKMWDLHAQPRRMGKTTLARYEAGELSWHIERPLSVKSANGAVLKIYNE